MKTEKKLLGAGILAAIAASLCCITPVLALIAGTSGVASSFSWMEPFRPYLIGFTFLVLAFAWYQKLKPRTKEEIACACEEDEKPAFTQSKMFLGLVTVFAALMLAFPYYTDVFYPEPQKQVIVVESKNVKTLNVNIEGMTCDACQNHINHAVNELDGIVLVNSSYQNGNAVIEYDATQTDLEEIRKAINSTGYTVTQLNTTKK